MRVQLAVFALACLLTACTEQHLHDTNTQLLQSGDYEAAVDALDAAARQYPNNAQLRADAVQARRQALAQLLATAARARAQQRYDDAQAALERARRFDSHGERVDPLLAELLVERRQVEALARAEALVGQQDLQAAAHVVTEALKDNPRQGALLTLQRRIEQLARQAQPPGALALRENRPISLDFRDASLRTVLEAVTRDSGIDFILDKDLHADARVTIFLHGARVEDALDLITSTNQLTRKTIDERTVLIYPNTPDKQRDYQEQVVRLFYLSSTEAKGAAAFLKAMLKGREPFVDERANLLALRDSPENVALAERLLSLYDTADPEVTLEMEVLEVGSTRLTELGLQFPNSITLTPLAPSGSTGLTLGNITGLTRNDVGVSVGGLLLNLRREVGDTRTLANPSVRVRSKEKAKVMIGDKVPVITTTTGQVGFVSDSVSYLDVGLQLEVEPTVFANDDVGIKMGLEVSSVSGQVKTANGTLAYQIGTRNATTTLRLHDGETQLLAGLISQDERSTASRIPGLGDLPVAGRLFSSQLDNGQHTELVLAVTPRIVRNVRRPDASEAELWIGTESAPRLRAVSNRAGPGSITPPAGAGSAATASTGQSASTAGVAPPHIEAAAASVDPAVTALPTLRLSGPSTAHVGDIVRLVVNLESTVGLRGLPIQLHYDKTRLELLVVDEGEFFQRDGEKTSFTRTIEAAEGTARVGVLRNSASLVAGKGAVYLLQFKALAAGPAPVAITSANAMGAGAPSALTLPPPLSIEVQ